MTIWPSPALNTGGACHQAMPSDADLSARVREVYARKSRSVSDAEPNMKKVRFAEHTTVPVSPAVSTSHTVSALVGAWWIIVVISTVRSNFH